MSHLQLNSLLTLTLNVKVFPICSSSALKVKVSLSLPFRTGLKAIGVEVVVIVDELPEV
jgi:hypothetical protein